MYRYLNEIKLPIQDKYKESLNRVLENDSLELIDYISLDEDYDGKIFKPSIKIMRDKKKLDTKITGTLTKRRCMALKTYDTFGIGCFKVIKL